VVIASLSTDAVPADSAEAMADALAGTIARVAPEGVHVVAHSLGGAIGALLAERRPDLVASLTLIAPAGMGPEINAAFIEGMNRATGAASGFGSVSRMDTGRPRPSSAR
jgi:pyruvate dehydrogenase E2 component (dihydrolipoamide acetyltransferase)